MKTGDEKEERLLSLLAVERPEAFWAARRAGIMAAVRGPRRGRFWLPAAAAAAALVVALALPWRGDRASPEEAAVSPAFLDHLDLLADMDVLEALKEEEL